MNVRIAGAAVRSLIVPLTVAMVLATFTYALTSSNTVPGSNAGQGAQTVAGYTVSNVHYNLNASDPRNVDSVQFDLAPAPPAGSTIRAKIQAAATSFATCTLAGARATCPTGGTAATADELNVIVAQ